jgi:hypothetical protein
MEKLKRSRKSALLEGRSCKNSSRMEAFTGFEISWNPFATRLYSSSDKASCVTQSESTALYVEGIMASAMAMSVSHSVLVKHLPVVEASGMLMESDVVPVMSSSPKCLTDSGSASLKLDDNG